MGIAVSVHAARNAGHSTYGQVTQAIHGLRPAGSLVGCAKRLSCRFVRLLTKTPQLETVGAFYFGAEEEKAPAASPLAFVFTASACYHSMPMNWLKIIHVSELSRVKRVIFRF